MTSKDKKPKLARLATSLNDFEMTIKLSHAQLDQHIVGAKCPDKNLDIAFAYANSLYLLNEYTTLDWQHMLDIIELRKRINEYANDRRRKGPLNIVLHAEPGSGKSHFVECLARGMA